MGNIRVYELAKQLGMDNKVVKQILNEHGFEVKSHMSNVSEDAIDVIKKATSKNEPKKEVVKNEAPKQNTVEEPKKDKNTEKPANQNKGGNREQSFEKKKSHITQVYNPQNSGSKDSRDNRNRDNRNRGGQNRDNRDNRDNRGEAEK